MTDDEFLAQLASALPKASPTLLASVYSVVSQFSPTVQADNIKAECAARTADINAGFARAKDLIQAALNKVDAGDLTTVVPTFDQLATAFRGS